MEGDARAQAIGVYPLVLALDHAGRAPGAIAHFPETILLSATTEGLLPLERLARLDNFGHSLKSSAYLYSPGHVEQLNELVELSKRTGSSIAMRGAGRSYGDAALNSGQIVLDLRGLNRVLEWDAQTGRIRVEPGVTIEQLWKHVLADGWWPPVVPGTMFPTLGGCLAANIHGKNNWQAGPLGEHVLEFEAILISGKTIKCSPQDNAEMFYAMIGGMGLLGIFISITMQLKKIYSGDVEVKAWAEPTLAAMLDAVDANKEADYIVGWTDCTAGGRGLGRGQMHRARYLKTSEDDEPQRTLSIEHQELGDRLFGLVPKKMLPAVMKLAMNNPGVWATNSAKYLVNRTIGNHKTQRQSLVAFNFLLDYIPNWERAYGRGGLIQYQSFLPKDKAADAYVEMLRLCKRRGLPSYLGVMKRHRPDKFLLSHAVDGYSLALDFRVTNGNRKHLVELDKDLDEIAIAAGGRFYFAKDSLITAENVRRSLGDKTIEKFRKLKTEVDPNNFLQSDLYRRCFGAQ
ncbi:MAG: FAD-binding oxidoreductase [Anaerolineales bacterium]